MATASEALVTVLEEPSTALLVRDLSVAQRQAEVAGFVRFERLGGQELRSLSALVPAMRADLLSRLSDPLPGHLPKLVAASMALETFVQLIIGPVLELRPR